MRDRNGGYRKLGKSGREQALDECLPESGVKEAPGQLQPGGQTFAKPRVFYPNDGCYEKPGDSSSAEPQPQAVKGMPVSGRPWKLDFKRHSSVIKKPKLSQKTWEEKMNAKKKFQTVKAKENAIKQARIDEKREKRQRQIERKAQKEANILKGAVAVAISTNTVKKMSRKQLRDVRKMDVHSNINPAPIQKSKGLNGKVKI